MIDFDVGFEPPEVEGCSPRDVEVEMAVDDDVASGLPEVDDTGLEACEELPTMDETEDCDPLEVVELYRTTDASSSTPAAVDEDNGVKD